MPDEAVGKRLKCPHCTGTFIAAATSDGKKDATVDRPAPSTPAASPQMIGRFEVRGKLGAGAFGAVYRAYDPQLDREVALKVPHAAVLDNPKRVQRFLREAKAAANLRHPHIVPVYDAGKDGEQYYIASAFIRGQKLADAVEASDGGLAFDRTARLVWELAEALAYAHGEGIIHRDVKPDNVMLDAQDRVHLMDFGLAARQDAESKLTNDGAVIGTPNYMAPEQAKGDTAAVGPAADQYSCGVVLYELLTGKTPFSGPVAAVILNQIRTEPDPPSMHRPDVPKDLETICLMAMNKRPEDRYPSCQALADDLRRWQEGEPVSVRPLNAIEKMAHWVRKKPALAGLYAAGLAGVVLITVAIGFAVLAGKAVTARGTAEQAQAEAVSARDELAEQKREVETARDLAEKAKSEAVTARDAEEEQRKLAVKERERFERFEYGRTLQVAHQEWRENNVAATVALLDSTRADLRGWEWRYVYRLCNTQVLALKGHTDHVYTASFSADGSRIVTASWDRTAKVWDAKSGAEVLTLSGHTNNVESASFSADGTRIVTASADNTAKVWDAKSGAEVLTLKGHTNNVTSASFSSDGTRIVTTSWDRTAKVWDTRPFIADLAAPGKK